MNKVLAVIDLFRKGESVANVSAWKTGQVSANALALALLAVVATLRAFGINLGLSDADATAIAGGILALVNFVITNVSSAHAGILPAKSDVVGVASAPLAPRVTGSVAEPDDHRLAAEALSRLRASASHTDPFHDSGT